MALAARVRELFRFDRRSLRALERNFIAPHIVTRDDVAARRAKLADIIGDEIIPYLVRLHQEAPIPELIAEVHPDAEDVKMLARIVLGPDADAAASYVGALRTRGVTSETLFAELLEPTARLLGDMWVRDECDFIDVTLGVARLQKLLAIGNASYRKRLPSDRRAVLMATAPGEQHYFGLSVIEEFLTASRWQVADDHAATLDSLRANVTDNWYAVVGLALGHDELAGQLAEAIGEIRRCSRNKAVRIMVGGSSFNRDPGLAEQVGADATARNAAAAVLIAQKLFDEGALANWGEA